MKDLMKPGFKVIADISSGMYSVCDEGYIINNRTNKRLKTYINKKKNGYEYIKLQDGYRQRSFHIGVLVGIAFVPNPENKKTINHEDGNKLNNHYTNLKWNTQKENSLHAFKNGLGKSGFDHYNSKFSQENFWEIKLLKDKGLKNFQIARLYNVSETAIRNLVLGNSYKHVEYPKFDLLSPRFKVKIRYPFTTFEIGEVITTSKNSFLYRTLKDFPEVFNEIEWWEDREESEIKNISYVKVINYEGGFWNKGSVVKIIKFSKDKNKPLGYYVTRNSFIPVYNLQPATKVEYEEYLNQNK